MYKDPRAIKIESIACTHYDIYSKNRKDSERSAKPAKTRKTLKITQDLQDLQNPQRPASRDLQINIFLDPCPARPRKKQNLRTRTRT